MIRQSLDAFGYLHLWGKPRHKMSTKWKTITEVVDVTTGELIKKKEVENGNYTIKSTRTIKVERVGDYTIRHTQWWCEPTKQYKLF